MSSSTGNKFKVQIFGQSHSEAIGVVIDSVPAGIRLDAEFIGKFMKRRAPGKNKLSTPRKEADIPEIISGLVDGVTCGAPVCAVIRNTNVHSSDYDFLKDHPRPSHSDFPAYIKYSGFNDIRGGGQFSGRLTAPLCFAGAVAMQILKDKGVEIKAHVYSVNGVYDEPFNPLSVQPDDLTEKEIPVLNDEKGRLMAEKITLARQAGDSVGGIIECAVSGVPAGLGDPMFDGIENIISRNVFAVPAVKGIEFGSGFSSSEKLGSENNDNYIIKDGKIVTETNNSGGIAGGITTGMPVIFRAAVKPTASIAKKQRTVSLSEMQETDLEIKGRHDPCIAIRAVPVIEACAAITFADLMI